MRPTRYLVQSQDNSLHGYDREDILRCDLASNKENPPKQVFRLSQTALSIRYDPIDLAEVIEYQPQPTKLQLVTVVAA